jgi:hypothetical protein
MLLAAVDPSLLVPHLDPADALRFLAFVLWVVVLPGHALRQLAGLRIAGRTERWAWTLCLGILWSSGVFYSLQKLGRPGWHLPLALAPLLVNLLLYGRPRRLVRTVLHSTGSRTRESLGRGSRTITDSLNTFAGGSNLAMMLVRARWHLTRGWTTAQFLGLALLASFVVLHLVRISSLVEYDSVGLRLYGELHGDKFNLMSQCAAVEQGLPPHNLRYAQHSFPYHFFPHLFVASCKLATGVDYIHGFLFYATALGIVAQGLAILGFCRRIFHSHRAGLLFLFVYGLFRFGPDAKPLDLTFAFLLLGLMAIDRLAVAGRWRWAACASLLLGAMPCYEALHALTTYAGLGLWWIVGWWPLIKVVITRRGPVSGEAWRQLRLRTLIVGPTCVASLLAAQLLASGELVISPAKFVWSNTYRKEFTHEWREWLKASPEDHPVARTIYQWKRNEPAVPRGMTAEQVGVTRPAAWQRIGAELVFSLLFIGYFLLQYLGVGVFGCQALYRSYRAKTTWRAPQSVMACIALAGFAIPAMLNWGHFADDQWWWSPNLCRLNGFALLVLLAAGAATMVEALRSFRRPRLWLPLGIAAWALCVGVMEWTNSSHAYYLLEHDRLVALAYLRHAVPYGQIVLHPWEHYEIRDARQQGKVITLHKRQFSLGSALAGQQMFYEGPEHHQFGSTFLTADEVFHRSRSRRAFFDTSSFDTSARLAVIADIFQQADVRWIVADVEHPAPAEIDRDWPLVYSNATVRIYCRPISLVTPTNLVEK